MVPHPPSFMVPRGSSGGISNGFGEWSRCESRMWTDPHEIGAGQGEFVLPPSMGDARRGLEATFYKLKAGILEIADIIAGVC